MAQSNLTLSRFPKARVPELIILWSYFLLQFGAAVYGLWLIFLTLFLGVNGVSGTDLRIFFAGYLLTIAGISLANHRQFTHPGFKTHTAIKWVFYALAAMAFQGKMRYWGTDHRHHHRNPDVPCTTAPKDATCDTHTPLDGFWHAHIGWLIRSFDRPIDKRWENAQQKLEVALRSNKQSGIAELEELAVNNRLAAFFDRTAIFWLLFGLALPAVIGGYLSGSMKGFWSGLLWGGLIRIFATNTSTGLINSYCHKPGWPGNYRHNQSAKDNSQNNVLLGILTLNPEVLHANHHQVSSSANHAIYWWEYLVDWSAWVIFILWKLGLAWDVQWTTPAKFEEKIQRSETGHP